MIIFPTLACGSDGLNSVFLPALRVSRHTGSPHAYHVPRTRLDHERLIV